MEYDPEKPPTETPASLMEELLALRAGEDIEEVLNNEKFRKAVEDGSIVCKIKKGARGKIESVEMRTRTGELLFHENFEGLKDALRREAGEKPPD